MDKSNWSIGYRAGRRAARATKETESYRNDPARKSREKRSLQISKHGCQESYRIGWKEGWESVQPELFSPIPHNTP